MGWKIYITEPWGKPSGMWTQMVLNFHIFNFYTTQFSHITHATLKCLSHTKSGIQHTCSLMSNLRHPAAVPPASHSLAPARSFLFLSKVLVCVLLHLNTIVCKANKRRKVSLVIFSSYYVSSAALGCDWFYFCFMSVTALPTSSLTNQDFVQALFLFPLLSLFLLLLSLLPGEPGCLFYKFRDLAWAPSAAVLSRLVFLQVSSLEGGMAVV